MRRMRAQGGRSSSEGRGGPLRRLGLRLRGETTGLSLSQLGATQRCSLGLFPLQRHPLSTCNPLRGLWLAVGGSVSSGKAWTLQRRHGRGRCRAGQRRRPPYPELRLRGQNQLAPRRRI